MNEQMTQCNHLGCEEQIHPSEIFREGMCYFHLAVHYQNRIAELSQPWISFKDRFPPVDTYILVRSRSGNFLATMADKDEGQGKWEGFTDWQLITFPSIPDTGD